MLTINEDGRADGGTICRAFGELDAFTVSQFRNTLARLSTSRWLVIDLSGVPFVDSAGLGALVGGIRRVRDHGGEVVLACNRPALLNLLGMTGIDRIVSVATGVDEAVAVLEYQEPSRPPRALQLCQEDQSR
jgi:anti-sigma B factor antagonist